MMFLNIHIKRKRESEPCRNERCLFSLSSDKNVMMIDNSPYPKSLKYLRRKLHLWA